MEPRGSIFVGVMENELEGNFLNFELCLFMEREYANFMSA